MRIRRSMEQSPNQTKKIEENVARSKSNKAVVYYVRKTNYKRPNQQSKSPYQNKENKQRNPNKNYNQQRNANKPTDCNTYGRCGNKTNSSRDCQVTKGKECNKCGIMGHFAKYFKTNESSFSKNIK